MITDIEITERIRCAETDPPEQGLKVLVYSTHRQPGSRWQFGYWSDDDGWVIEFATRQKPLAYMALPHDLLEILK